MARKPRVLTVVWKAVVIVLALSSGGFDASAEKAATSPERLAPAPEFGIIAHRPAAGSASVSGLADTQWRLVEFQSIDDAGGTIRPDDPSKYTGTMVPYWRFEGQGIASRMGQEKGRRSIALAYLDGDLKEGEEIKISSRGKFLSGQLVKRHMSAEAPPYSRPILVEEILVKRPGPKEPLFESVEMLVKKARDNTFWRQRQTINLIPSEQTPSPLVKLLSISDPCARYAEHRNYKFLGEADVFYYQGTDFIEWVEVKLQEEMARFLGCSVVETRITSGQMANAAVFSAFVDYLNRAYRRINPRKFRKVMNHHLGRGGHLSSHTS